MDMKYKKTQMEKCMVKKMNKEKFIDLLASKLNVSINDALKINSVLNENFFLSKKSKDKVVCDLQNILNINEEKATGIYNECVNIVKTEIKNKLRHPFTN